MTKAKWALRTFTRAEIAAALAKVKPLPSSWRPRSGTLIDLDGVRTGQVSAQPRISMELPPRINPRDRLHVISALIERKRTG